MFTGIVEALGTVHHLVDDQQSRTLTIENPFDTGLNHPSLHLGDSVAINGCCLTIVDLSQHHMVFQAGSETLSKTNLGLLRPGDRVNLERAMRADGRLGGHLVQGHVDATGVIASRDRAGEWETVYFRIGELTKQLIPKGSITVDGISLTVVDITADSFSVALIPHTLSVTTLGIKQVGDTVNIELDMVGKYIHNYLNNLSLTGVNVAKQS